MKIKPNKYPRGGQAGWRNPNQDDGGENYYGHRPFAAHITTDRANEYWQGSMPGAPNAANRSTPNQGFDFGALFPLFADSFGGFLNQFQNSDPSTWSEGMNIGSISDFGLDAAGEAQANQMADQFGSVFGLMEQLQQFQNQPRNNFNPQNWTVNPTRGNFQLGGDPTQPSSEPVAIQAEKGEMVSLPDNSISKVKATKRHKQMSDDEVTDVLPAGSFVTSDHKSMKFSKEDMEKVSFGYGPIQYKEGGTAKPPKELTAADIMSKKKMTPAEYMKEIKRKFPTKGDEEDPFAMLADEENLESRTPYIASAKYITEMKKSKQDKQRDIPQAELGYVVPPTGYYNALNFTPIQATGYKRGGGIPKALTGLETFALSAIGQLINQGMSALAQRRANRIMREANAEAFKRFGRGMDDLEDTFTEGAGRQRDLLGAGTALGIAGDLMQDTDYTVPQLDTRFVDAMPQQMPRTAMEQARRDMRMALQPAVNYATRNAPSFSRASGMLAANRANQMDAISGLAGQQSLQNLNLRNNYLQQRGALANQQNMLDAEGENRRRQASNQRLASITGRGTAYTSGLGSIDANLTTNRANILDRRTMTEMQYILAQAKTRQADAFALASGLQIPTQNMGWLVDTPQIPGGQMSGGFGSPQMPLSQSSFNLPMFSGVNLPPMNSFNMPSFSGGVSMFPNQTNPWQNALSGNYAPNPGLGMWNYQGPR